MTSHFSSLLRRLGLWLLVGSLAVAATAVAIQPANADQLAPGTDSLSAAPAPGTQSQSAANGAPGSSGAIAEVVVTARRREEVAQDVPLSLVAVDLPTLTNIGFTALPDLKEQVSSLDITPDNNTPDELLVFIRGIGGTDAEQLSRDNDVGVYLDDVYVGHGMMLATELLDIARVEVLPGPQGVLYGRNTIGGAVKFVSQQPSGVFDFETSSDAGNYGYVREFASVDLPTTKNVSVMVSGVFSHFDGWVENTGSAGNFGRNNDLGERVALHWQPVEDLTVDYAFDHSASHGTPDLLQFQYPLNYFGIQMRAPVSERQDTTWRPVNLPQSTWFIGGGNSLTAVWGITSQLSLKSISAYRNFNGGFFNDTVEGFGFPFVQSIPTTQHQFSQEFILTGTALNNTLNYHLGLFYFKEGGTQYYYQANDFVTLGAAVPYVPPGPQDVNLNCICVLNNTSKAAYGQATWALPFLDRRLSIDVGARESWDTREAQRHRPYSVAPIPVDDANSVSYASFDPEATVDFKLTSSAHVYAKIAKSYQAGGFDAFNNDFLVPYRPEHVTAYEVGLKSELLDRHVLFNADVFDEQYKDLQEIFYDPAYNGGATETVNAGHAVIKGVETEIQAVPISALHLSANATHLETDGTITDPFTLQTTTGDLPNAPHWKYSVNTQYTLPPFNPGIMSVFVSYTYNGDQLPVGEPLLDWRPSYWLLDARLTISEIDLGSGKLSVAAWGKNLTDKAYQTYHAYGAVQWGLPRTYGLNISYEFGHTK